MKKFKKSEIAIYAIALMLVTAGYFNYTTFEKKTEETYSEDVGNIDSKYANVGDAVLVSNNETKDTSNEVSNNTPDVSPEPENNKTENNEQNEQTEVSSNEQNQNIQNQGNETVNTNTNPDETNYYISSKLDRDKMYAEMVSNYEKILNNGNASETQKSIVAQEVTKINNTKNAIMICENLILTKGFQNCIILINDKSVNVVVKVEGGLSTEKVAKVQNIISRELGTEIENIHITEK